ncbi:peptidoglycan editing factor PgeF [Marinicella meishanensis]|uniref:peptidoglycan editing factor PgeF n=1 Tax=Marinicella meishanensis TaxID=2873263 RepID=UPI001CBEDAB0|nr:peptidoglycan editing factor PgeF [Marinicella sp. NBU2979]
MTDLIEPWSRPAHVAALQTTRTWQQNPNFSAHPKHSQASDLQRLVEQFALPHEPRYLHQVHGHQVIEYSQPQQQSLAIQADACFTREYGVVCAVMTADCLPVLLTDTEGSFVAAVHCGWRSLYAQILTNTLAQIQPPADVLAWLGPCIQRPQYQVDLDFVAHFLQRHPHAEAAFDPPDSLGKCRADLVALARMELQALGVRQITQDPTCTFLSPKHHSWRRDQAPERMASLIWLNHPSG